MATPRLSKSYAADRASVVARLSKIEGQVRGIRRMVEEGRYCVDVLQQIASLRSGADAVGRMLVEDHIRGCVAQSVDSDEGNDRSPDEMVDELMSVVRRAVRS